jgi:hypothetical protein
MENIIHYLNIAMAVIGYCSTIFVILFMAIVIIFDVPKTDDPNDR